VRDGISRDGRARRRNWSRSQWEERGVADGIGAGEECIGDGVAFCLMWVGERVDGRLNSLWRFCLGASCFARGREERVI